MTADVVILWLSVAGMLYAGAVLLCLALDMLGQIFAGLVRRIMGRMGR